MKSEQDGQAHHHGAHNGGYERVPLEPVAVAVSQFVEAMMVPI